MRPIDKGTWPLDANLKKIEFNSWGEAKPYLIKNTGRFCHFCEMKLDNSPGIEHIKPKALKHSPNLQNHWDNLMLSCVYCNSRKTKDQIKLYNYYWPHKHNTFKALNITNLGVIIVDPAIINPSQVEKANNLIQLYGLNESEDSSGGIDSRLLARLESLSNALERLNEFERGLCTINAIIANASSGGFWSVWYRVFANHITVRDALIKAPTFNGTMAACFNAASRLDPIDRNPGASDPL